MGKHHTKSASNILHGILVQHPIGYEFDVASLTEESENYGYDFTTGAITGFIARALRKEIINIKGTARDTGTKRTKRVYTLVDKQDWQFKPAGIGSYPGRELHRKASGDQPELMLEPREEAPKSAIIKKIAHDLGIPIINMPPVADHHVDALIGLPIVHVEDHPIDVGPLIEEPKEEPLSLHDQLISVSVSLGVIAAQVMDLENKPDKSLADYSTNDLIEELRKRIK